MFLLLVSLESWFLLPLALPLGGTRLEDASPASQVAWHGEGGREGPGWQASLPGLGLSDGAAGVMGATVAGGPGVVSAVLWLWAPLCCEPGILCPTSQVLWFSGLWAQLLWPRWGRGSQALPPLYLQAGRCEGLSRVLVYWAEEPLLSCGCFTNCTLKGVDRGSISCPRGADLESKLAFLIKEKRYVIQSIY